MRRTLTVGLSLLALALGWWVVQVAFLDVDARSAAATYGQFVLAALGLAVSVIALWRTYVSPSTISLDQLSDEFASAMYRQANATAAERSLKQAPMRVQWTGVSNGITGSTAAATAYRDTSPRFPPLPGLNRVTSADLRRGDQKKLHMIYGGLPSGRLIIVGPPGSGKSSAAVLLQLEALKFREQTTNEHDRHRIPIPVIFTLHGWDPRTTPVEDWLVSKLALVPLLRGRMGARQAQELLTRHITVVLDGLDEIAEKLRPVAMQVLTDQATFRLILLSRTHEMVAAARKYGLVGAAAVELQPLTPPTTIRYLIDPMVKPVPAPWTAIADAVKDGKTPLALALGNPLEVGLLHDVYPLSGNSEGDVDELLDVERFPNREAITQHLLGRAVEAAYTSRPARPASRYSPATARRTLDVIARKLNQDPTGDPIRDFTWWDVIAWSPLSGHLVSAAPTVLVTFPGVLIATALITFLAGNPFWVILGVLAGLAVAIKFLAPAAKYPLTLGGSLKSRNLRRGTMLGLVLGLCFGLWAGSEGGFAGGFAKGYIGGLGVCLPIGLVGGLVVGLLDHLAQQGRSDTTPPDPVNLWRAEFTTIPVLVLAFAPAGAIAFGLVGAVIGGFERGMEEAVVGVFIGITVAVTVWTALSKTIRTALAQLYLAARYRTPVRLLRFLEDARSRHILRTVGPVYQFRHATLQDYLADHPSMTPPEAKELTAAQRGAK